MSALVECQWCSNSQTKIYHNGVCPKVKSIEYDKNGRVKKIEFKDTDYYTYPTTGANYTVQWLTY